MDENKCHRGWFRFGTRDLLWAMIVVSIFAAWLAGSRRDSAEPVVPRSYLMWYCDSLGFRYAITLPLVGLFSFMMTIVLLVRCRGQLLGVSLAFVVAAPVLLGLIGTLSGVMAAYQVIGESSVLSPPTPRFSEVAEGISMALVSMHVGLLLAFPSFGIATIGLVHRALAENGRVAGV
jgi:membrane-associated HD superfamily phosphohydrolase